MPDRTGDFSSRKKKEKEVQGREGRSTSRVDWRGWEKSTFFSRDACDPDPAGPKLISERQARRISEMARMDVAGSAPARQGDPEMDGWI